MKELCFYLYNGYTIDPTVFCLFKYGQFSLYTAYLFFKDIIREAWMQYKTNRFVVCKYDNDDYYRYCLQFCILRFKILELEATHKIKG